MPTTTPRVTKYAKEIRRAAVTLPDGDEVRIERLRIAATGDVVIRFSWWKGRNMMPRPSDLSEADLLKLLARGLREGVLLPDEDDPA